MRDFHVQCECKRAHVDQEKILVTFSCSVRSRHLEQNVVDQPKLKRSLHSHFHDESNVWNRNLVDQIRQISIIGF